MTITITAFIVPSIDIPMSNIKYLAINKVKMHFGAISMLLYVLRVCTDDILLVDAHGLSSHTDTHTDRRTLTLNSFYVQQLLRENV